MTCFLVTTTFSAKLSKLDRYITGKGSTKHLHYEHGGIDQPFPYLVMYIPAVTAAAMMNDIIGGTNLTAKETIAGIPGYRQKSYGKLKLIVLDTNNI